MQKVQKCWFCWSEGERRSVPPNGKLPELVCESDGKASVVGRRSAGGGAVPDFHFRVTPLPKSSGVGGHGGGGGHSESNRAHRVNVF